LVPRATLFPYTTLFRSLSFQRALVVEKKVLGELLGDRGAALHDAARGGIGGQRAQRAGRIDAEVLVEAAILGGQHGSDEVVRIVDRKSTRLNSSHVSIS